MNAPPVYRGTDGGAYRVARIDGAWCVQRMAPDVGWSTVARGKTWRAAARWCNSHKGTTIDVPAARRWEGWTR